MIQARRASAMIQGRPALVWVGTATENAHRPVCERACHPEELGRYRLWCAWDGRWSGRCRGSGGFDRMRGAACGSAKNQNRDSDNAGVMESHDLVFLACLNRVLWES